jgi:hypothetical protein
MNTINSKLHSPTLTALSVLAVVPFMLAACAPPLLFSLEVSGQVVEQGSDRPVGGAFVVLRWSAKVVPKGFTGHNSSTVCYHTASALTDDRGNYSVPGWLKAQKHGVPNADFAAFAYKEGYSFEFSRGARIVMHPFEGSKAERLQELFQSVPRCFDAGASERSLYPLRAASYLEAKRLVDSGDLAGPQNAHMLNVLRLEAAHAFVAEDNLTMAQQEAKANAFLKDHLQ